MKKISRTAVSFILASALLIVVVCASFAVSGLSVNGIDVKKGSIITYTFSVSEFAEPAVGINMSLYFDPAYLEYVKGTFSTPNIQGAVVNDTQDGEILFNFSSSKGIDFSKKTVIATAQFKAKSDYSMRTEITFYIREFYDIDFIDHPFLTFCSMSVDGKPVITDGKPILDPAQSGGDIYDDDTSDPDKKPTGSSSKAQSSASSKSNYSSKSDTSSKSSSKAPPDASSGSASQPADSTGNVSSQSGQSTGSAASAEDTSLTVTPTTVSPSTTVTAPDDNDKDTSLWIYIVGIIILIAVGATGLIFFLKMRRQNKENK